MIAYSAGSAPADRINPAAAVVMAALFLQDTDIDLARMLLAPPGMFRTTRMMSIADAVMAAQRVQQ